MLPFAEYFHESKSSPRRDPEDEKKKEKRFSFFILKVSGSFMSSGDSSRSAFLDVSSGSGGEEYVGSSWGLSLLFPLDVNAQTGQRHTPAGRQ